MGAFRTRQGPAASLLIFDGFSMERSVTTFPSNLACEWLVWRPERIRGILGHREHINTMNIQRLLHTQRMVGWMFGWFLVGFGRFSFGIAAAGLDSGTVLGLING